jgi:hypothetical protein
MPRPVRKKIKFTEESVNDLFQEYYNDTHSTRTEIKALFAKWNKFVNEGGEIAAIGKDITALLQIELKNQEQKLLLLKYLKDIVFTTEKKSKDSKEEDGLNSDEKSELVKMVKETMMKGKHESN